MTTMPPIRRVIQGLSGPFVAPFEDGDVLDQPTFHKLYEAAPEGFRAELIGGVVHLPSPVSMRHGKPHLALGVWLGLYSAETDGTEAFIDITTIMASDSEPQPDVSLIISPEAGGQTASEDDYLTGSPELAVEISHTTTLVDLHAKKQMYEKYGVREYIVVETKRRAIHWFLRRDGHFVAIKPGADGLLKSRVFPGLWLDPAALFERSPKRVLAALRSGLATPEHAKFAAKLQAKLAKARR